MERLPRPVTTPEAYLAAILDELRALRATLAPAPAQPATDEVELREPKKPTKGKK